MLFRNKRQYKVIKKCKQYKTALDFFNKKKLESDSVLFEKQYQNGFKFEYELAILVNEKKSGVTYKKDNIGRNIPIIIDDNNYSVSDIIDFKIEETIVKIGSKDRFSLQQLANIYLKGTSIKLISKLNNKIIIQDDDNFILFSCKCDDDAGRFINNLENYLIDNNIVSAIIVRDKDVAQKKYLYKMFESLGYNKDMLYRKSTTHLRSK